MNNLNSKKFECTGCFLCGDICPTGAIKMVRDEEGFYQFNIEENKCTECGLCVKKCPKLNAIKKNKASKNCYAAYSKDNDVLFVSSSGGIFSELAKVILTDNGVVIGAAWIENDIKHIYIDSLNDLEKLRSSKYIQSNLEGIYMIIKEKLNEKRKVLFTGTPCQVAAVKNFIEDDNLYLIDLVCHGVPSKLVLDASIKQRFNKDDLRVNFRSKTTGWHYKYSLEYYNKNYKKTNKNTADGWFKGYLNNNFLKKDCYDCNFTGINRVADITLGDFWEIGQIDQEFYKENNDKGVSLVLINNDKGKNLFDQIKENIVFKEENIELAVKYNPRITNGKYDKEDYNNRIKKPIKLKQLN